MAGIALVTGGAAVLVAAHALYLAAPIEAEPPPAIDAKDA